MDFQLQEYLYKLQNLIINKNIQTLLIMQMEGIKSLNQQQKQFLLKAVQKYSQKFKCSIQTQGIEASTQIQHLKQIIRSNEDRLTKQKLQMDDMLEKVKIIQVRTQSKLLALTKQLQNFTNYYDQCYQYTMKRINQISDKVNNFTALVCKQTKNQQLIPVTQYIKHTNEMLVNILKGNETKILEIKHYLDDQIFELDCKLGNFIEHFQKFDDIINSLKINKYGNQSLKQAIQAATKMIEGKKEGQMSNSQVGKKVVAYYEPKFKQIIKRINTYSMQIELVKSMINCQNNETRVKNQMKQKQFNQLKQKLDQLQKLIQEQKKNYDRNLNKKQEILKKRHDRILELEESMHRLLQKQVIMQHQISQLKFHNLQLTKQLKKFKLKDFTNKQVQTQSKNSNLTKQKSNLTTQEEKLILLELQYQNLINRYQQQEKQVILLRKQLLKYSQNIIQPKITKSQRFRSEEGDDFENFLNLKSQRSKSKTKDNRNSKSCIKISPMDTKSTIKINKYNQKNQVKLAEQNEKLTKINQQLMKTNRQLQQQIDNLLNSKTQQNKQDDQYLDQIQADLEKNNIQIQRLMAEILELCNKNNELQTQNDHLIIEIQKLSDYQLKYNNCKNLANKLDKIERQYQNLTLKNKQLLKKLSYYEDISLDDSNQKNRQFFQSTFSSPNAKGNQNHLNFLKQSKSSNWRQRKSNYETHFVSDLQNAILSLGLPIPIVCQIDNKGYIRQQKTGTYLVNQSKKPLILTEEQLDIAIDNGLLLM